ncbi:DUF6417 family protein [Streptomyces xinghaiensis]|uniref:DUF6417 family protein n=1 Tax=Streptomyces xinghaiensis TaxID=1038928 RepID=UPI002E13AD27|nr:DUF6417 family protein [Streptomyces xinghaiensis]
MLGKISDRQWEVLERLAEAEWAAETVRQCWIPVSGVVDGHAVRALEWAGLATTAPAEEALTPDASRPAPTRATRITPDGLDALAWRHGRTHTTPPSPAWAAKATDPAWREIALQPAEMLLLRRYAHLVPDLTGAPAPAETLWEALTEAHFDRDANRWRLQLDDTGLAGLAHAVHLEALIGGVTHRNRLRRAHDLDHPHPIPATSFTAAATAVVSLE